MAARSKNPDPVSKARKVMEIGVGRGVLGTTQERMGFLLWRPQLLSELWDQVSSGNNWRPLEKIYSEPGNRKNQGPRRRGEEEVGFSQNADQG